MCKPFYECDIDVQDHVGVKLSALVTCDECGESWTSTYSTAEVSLCRKVRDCRVGSDGKRVQSVSDFVKRINRANNAIYGKVNA